MSKYDYINIEFHYHGESRAKSFTIILILQYSNEDQAFETRQALHGISWPLSNPKKLHVEYATKEDMETARELSKEQPVARKTEPLSSDSWQQDWSRDEKTNTTKAKICKFA